MEKINNYFDKIFVINLESRLDKKVEISQKLNRLGVDYEIFNAINGYTEQNVKEFNDYFNKPISQDHSHELELKYNRKMIMSPGAWGLLKSYRKILSIAKKKGYKRILVFEDDVIFAKNFHNRFNKFISNVKDNWKLLLLGATQHVWMFPQAMTYKDKSIKEYKKDEPYYHPLVTDGAFAVGIDNSIFQELIDEIDKMNCAFDSGPLRHLFKKYHRECYVAQPNICIADVNTSNIGKERDQVELSTKVKWDLQLYDYPFKKELVSIVMPTYNAEKTIKKSIQSLLNQSYTNIEVIVVDDASTDDTVNVVKDIIKNDNRVVLLKNKINRGCYFVRNDALRIAKGSIIAIQDPDDIALKDRILKQVEAISCENCEFTIGRIYRSKCTIDELNVDDEDNMMNLVESRRIKNDKGYYEWLDRDILGFNTSMFKRSLFEEFGLFWEKRFSADAEILERILYKRINKLFTANEPNVHSFLMKTDKINNLYKQIKEVILISPQMDNTNLTNKYKGELREEFEKNWRLRLIGEYKYDYPKFENEELKKYKDFYKKEYGTKLIDTGNKNLTYKLTESEYELLLKQIGAKNKQIEELKNTIDWYILEQNKVNNWYTEEVDKLTKWHKSHHNNLPNWFIKILKI